MASELTLVQFGTDGLWAVRGSASPAGAVLEGWVHARPPAEAASTDAAALGAWAGKVLEEHRLGKSRVMLCVPRSDVVLKVLSLPPAAPGRDSAAELPPMVRLQMIRQLTLPAEGTAIDFVELPDDGSGQRRVLAAALPADRLAWLLAIAQGAGLKVRHIGLTSAGLAAAVTDISQRRDGAVLALAPFGQNVEMVVVENGVMTLSRSIEVPGLGDAPDPAASERLEVECRRTWASHHNARDGGPACVVWVGDGAPWAALAERCGQALDAPGLATSVAEGIRPAKPIEAAAASWALPLGGLLLSAGLSRPMLDFANPRKAPDFSARTRQGVLLGVMVLILVGVGLYILADHSLANIRRDLQSVRTAENDLRDRVAAFRVLHARVNDLEAWNQASPDWVGHLSHIGARFPDPHVVQFSSLSGAASGGAVFTPKGTYPGGAWGPRVQVELGLDGKMEDRGPIADLREALLSMGDYVVMSKGADVPSSFSLELSSDHKTPGVEKKPDKPADKNAKDAKPAPGKGGAQ